MLVTMILLSALIAGGAVLISVQISSNRSADLTRSGTSALYCAEAGLSAARPIVASNYTKWNAALLAGPVEPAWLSTGLGTHSIDGNGTADFEVYLKDNEDEKNPTANDPTRDNDEQVYIVVRCTLYPDTPKQVEELVLFNGGTTCYPWQQGGCGGDGNKVGE